MEFKLSVMRAKNMSEFGLNENFVAIFIMINIFTLKNMILSTSCNHLKHKLWIQVLAFYFKDLFMNANLSDC